MVLTVELLKHALNGTGAATAAHGDIEFVVVLGHGLCREMYVGSGGCLYTGFGGVGLCLMEKHSGGGASVGFICLAPVSILLRYPLDYSLDCGCFPRADNSSFTTV